MVKDVDEIFIHTCAQLLFQLFMVKRQQVVKNICSSVSENKVFN